MKLRADDRILSLGIPPVAEAAQMGRILIGGFLVALGTADEVHEARQALAEFDNLMFVEANLQSIPWRDAYFTKVIVPHHLRELAVTMAGEVQRVLAPGGEIVSDTEDV